MRILPLIVAIAAAASSARGQIGNIVVTSAATFQTGLPWAGSIASLFCTGLAGTNAIVVADGYPLPLELVGVRVRIGGVLAPLFAVAQLNGYQQINLQVPPGGLDATVTVEQGGQKTTVQVAAVTGAGVGQFFRLLDGSGAFQHSADYALVSAANPVRAGEVVIGYLTGLDDRTTPLVPAGQPAPADPPAVVSQVIEMMGASRPRFEIWMGEPPNRKMVAPLFLGLAPGLAGVFQVNFAVPDGLTGKQPVMLVKNACSTSMFSNVCLDVYPSEFSLTVPMAVQ